MCCSGAQARGILLYDAHRDEEVLCNPIVPFFIGDTPFSNTAQNSCPHQSKTGCSRCFAYACSFDPGHVEESFGTIRWCGYDPDGVGACAQKLDLQEQEDGPAVGHWNDEAGLYYSQLHNGQLKFNEELADALRITEAQQNALDNLAGQIEMDALQAMPLPDGIDEADDPAAGTGPLHCWCMLLLWLVCMFDHHKFEQCAQVHSHSMHLCSRSSHLPTPT